MHLDLRVRTAAEWYARTHPGGAGSAMEDWMLAMHSRNAMRSTAVQVLVPDLLSIRRCLIVQLKGGAINRSTSVYGDVRHI